MHHAAFDTPVTLEGPERHPRQMLAEQTYGGHASLHDEATADSLGISGAPIEGPTHFSQFDPLAHVLWGDAWFERGCISAHFQTMVVEGEGVTARAERRRATRADIGATKSDGSPVLTGSLALGPDEPTALDERRAKLGPPGELFIVDQISVGDRSREPVTAKVDLDTANGDLYPFSLAQKLDAITEPSNRYRTGDNPWGRPVLPMEMASVLTQKTGTDFPVRGPSIGLFLDLEVRLVAGPLFVDHEYVLEREVVALGQSRRTESHWVRTDVTDAESGDLVAHVLLHSGVFKESYAGYPADRLA
jgi:hypothetical protein